MPISEELLMVSALQAREHFRTLISMRIPCPECGNSAYVGGADLKYITFICRTCEFTLLLDNRDEKANA